MHPAAQSIGPTSASRARAVEEAAHGGSSILQSFEVHAGPRGISAKSHQVENGPTNQPPTWGAGVGWRLWSVAVSDVDPPRMGTTDRKVLRSTSNSRREAISVALSTYDSRRAVQLEWRHSPQEPQVKWMGPTYVLTLTKKVVPPHQLPPLPPPLVVSVIPFLPSDGTGQLLQQQGRAVLKWIGSNSPWRMGIISGCNVLGSVATSKVRQSGVPWGVMWLRDPLQDNTRCKLSDGLSQLASLGAAFTVLPEGLRCDGRANIEAEGTGGEGDGFWLPGWPRRTTANTQVQPCIGDAAGGTTYGGSAATQIVPEGMQVLRMPYLGLKVVEKAIRGGEGGGGGDGDGGGGGVWSVVASAVANEKSAIRLMPPSLQTLIAEPTPLSAQQEGAGHASMRLVQRGEWQLLLQSQGEGRLAAHAAETEGMPYERDRPWGEVHSVLSTRQESLSQAGCHRPDKREGSACSKDGDCGVSGETCEHRRCSAYGYCFSPVR